MMEIRVRALHRAFSGNLTQLKLLGDIWSNWKERQAALARILLAVESISLVFECRWNLTLDQKLPKSVAVRANHVYRSTNVLG